MQIVKSVANGLGQKISSEIRLPSLPAIATASMIAGKLKGLAELDQQSESAGLPPMCALGPFTFGLSTIAYQELSRRTDWRHASAERLGAMPAFQFIGPGGDTISLPGILMPELTGPNRSIDELREMAATGEAFTLVKNSGEVVGDYMIRSIDEQQTNFLAGGVARRIEFTIELERANEA